MAANSDTVPAPDANVRALIKEAILTYAEAVFPLYRRKIPDFGQRGGPGESNER